MSYKIKSLAEHQANLESSAADQIRRLDYDVSDCALSTWATSSMQSFDNFAIRALELGAKNGIDGPAVEVPILRWKADKIVVEARLVLTRFGLKWHIDGAMEQGEVGKEWVGTSAKTLDKLCLYEDSVVLPSLPYADAHCPCIGAPVSFSLRPHPGAHEQYLRFGGKVVN